MNYIANKTVTYTNENGKPKVFQPGSVVPEKVYLKLAAHGKAKCSPVQRKYELYTRPERELILELYVEFFNEDGTVDYEAIFSNFHAYYPDRNFNSVKKLVYSIQGRDELCPQNGLGAMAQEMADLLHSYDPDRFPLTVAQVSKVDRLLDKLLEDIRA